MKSPSELWVLEWSQPQKVFHISTLEDAMKNNIEAFWNNRRPDWVLLAVLETHEEAHKIAKEFEMLECRGARALFQP